MILLTPTRRLLIWAIMAAIIGLLCVLAFRGYLSADMLFNLANSLYC
jgi:hypothetical protein